MNKVYTLLLVLLAALFGGNVFGQYSITGIGSANTYTQNFDAFRGTAATIPTNWALSGTANGTTANQIIYSGQTSPSPSTVNGNNYYAGRASSSSSDYSLLQKQGTSGSSTFTFSAKNNTGSTITGFVITWNIEQLIAGYNRAATVDFKYQINGGGYVSTGITGTTLYTCSTSGSTTPSSSFSYQNSTPTPYSITITGISVPNGQTVDFQFSVANGSGSGSNPQVGIDDFTMYATAPSTYTVTYDGNGSDGGSVPVDGSSPYISGSNVTVLGAGTLTKSGFIFSGWNTAANGTGTSYAAGSTITSIAANATLYAQWTASGSPFITVTPGAFTGTFGNQCIGSSSSAQSYTVAGGNLTGNISITAPAGFEIKTGAGAWGTSLTLTPSSGTVSSTTIDVRFSPGSAGAISGNISHASTGATTQTIDVSGSGVAAVMPTVSIASSPAAVSGTTTICAGTSVTFTPTPANLGGGTASYEWFIGGVSQGVSATFTSTTLTNGNAITCTMTVSGGCVSTTTANSNTINMVVNPAVTPAVSIAITTGSNPTCTGNALVLTATPTNGGGSPTYQWKNGAANIGTGSTYSNTAIADGSVITCVMTSNAACASPTTATSNSITITNNTPTQPSAITGATSVTPGQSGVSYSVTNVPGVTYTWSYIGGSNVNIASGQGTNTITLDFLSNATSGTLTVTPTVGGCNGTARTLAISVGPANDLCSNAIPLTIGAGYISGTFVGATATTGATSYAPTKKDVWYSFIPSCTGNHTITVTFSTGPDIDFDVFTTNCPSGSATAPVNAQSANATSESVTASFNAGTTYYIRVIDYYTDATTFNIQVTGNPPAQPAAFTSSSAAPCVGASTTYTVPAVTNASSYTWTLPAGWVGTSTTNSITVTPSITAGTVSVAAVNCYGTGTARTISVTPITVPATPGAISGNTTVCEGTANTYSVTAVSGATSYTWTLPGGGWSFTGSSNSINTTAGSTSGTISVTANNGCGSSPAQTLAVTVNPAPANPGGTITALANPSCGPTTVSYSAPSAAIFWQTSASGTSTASPTTTPYPVGSNGTTVYARAYNGTCWSTGTVNSGTVTINTQPNITTQPVDKTVASPTGTTFTVAASNAAGYQWQYFNGSAWVNLSNGAPYSGVTTATLTIASTTEAMDGTDYRCIVNAASPCTSVTSNVATLYVTPGPCISDAAGYTGWTLSGGASISTNQACSGNNILFTGTGQSVITPAVTNPQKLNFKKKRSSNTTAWTLNVQISTSASGPWTNVATLSISDITESCSAHPEIDLSAYTGTQYVRFLDSRASGGHERGIDDITITCGNACTPTHTITSFVPTSGPAGTLVTITGTGFTAVSGANAVKFGGTNAASYTVVNATTIIAEVPVGAPTDKITVVNNSCPLKSAADFTFIETDGTCGGTYSSDVFISEIYDHNNGSLTYIEIFNGTLSTVDLSNYSIRVQTNTTDNSYTLSGTIASSATKILKIGEYNTYTCSGLTVDWDYPSAPGINGNDRISLYKNSGATLVDYAPNPNYDAGAVDNGAQLIGFTQKRNATAVAPNTTYSAGDWTLSNTQSCSHLGTGPYTVSAPSLTVTSHPADVGCTSSLTFSVAASAGAPATISDYVWKFNDPATMTGWDNVSAMTGSPYNYPLTITGTGTNSITITGNTAILQDFQFYVEVKTSGSPQCIKSSNAAQYKYDTRPVYRSKANGNWSNPLTWEMSNTTGGPWVAVCVYPRSINSSQAIIQSGTSVVLDIDNDIDKLTIETTGTLEVSANSTLTVYDSTANADLIVNGTYFDRANSANSLNLSGTATWQLGASGTVIKSNTSSAATYRDQYESGIANIPDTATWIYRYNGDGNPTVVSAGMFYPNLFFENTTGSPFSFNNTLMILSGGTAAASLCTVKGNCNIGTTGTAAVTVYNNNLSTSPMLIYGNLTVGANSIFTNASYNGGSSSSYGNGTGFEVKGNVTVNGTLDANTASTGILKFSGTGTQVVSGSGTFDLWNVDLSKPAQTLVDQLVNLTANNNLNFVGGILKTNTNVFTVANADITNAVTGHEAPFTSVSGAPTYTNDRYVWGKLERNVNSNGIYVYPVGDAVAGEGYNPLRFDRKTGSGYATAEFIPGDPGACLIGPIYFTCNGENKFFQYSDMTGQGKWRMISSTATTFSYDIYLHPNQANINTYPNEDAVQGQLFYKNRHY